jgi:transcriptional regulator with XRE-family HTH domain
MGAARPRPQRLAEKLRQIRKTLGLSQSELLRQLRVQGEIPYTRISDYELDKNEPTLMVLLEYARVAGVHLEEIVDDRLDLPAELPGTVKYKNVRSKARLKRRNVP